MHYVEPILKSVMLNVTDDCNLRCRYCFVNKSPNYMPFKIAKDTVDLLLNIHRNDDIIPTITFFGGEPLLCWDTIIVPLVEYVKSLDKQVKFSITSNGTLLTEERLKYMVDNNIGLLLSIDGIKECQDFNRPCLDTTKSSFDMLESLLPLITKYLPMTTFRSTLYPQTCHLLFDNILFAEQQGFKGIFTVPDEGSIWTDEHKQIISEQLDKYIDYYISKFKERKSVIELTSISKMYNMFNIYRQALDNDIVYKTCDFPACGLGLDAASVNYEGKIYACQELPSNIHLNKKYFIGDIYNGIDKTKHDKLIAEYRSSSAECINPEMCKSCKIKPICNKLICHANAYIYNKSMNKKTEIKCFWDNLLFDKASNIINALEKDDAFIKVYIKRILNGD